MNQEFGFEQFEVSDHESRIWLWSNWPCPWIKNLTVTDLTMNEEFDSEVFDQVQVCCCLIVVTESTSWLWSNWPWINNFTVKYHESTIWLWAWSIWPWINHLTGVFDHESTIWLKCMTVCRCVAVWELRLNQQFDFEVFDHVQVCCCLTGHEMPIRGDAVQSYVKGKKFLKAQQQREFDFDQYKPHLVPNTKRGFQ